VKKTGKFFDTKEEHMKTKIAISSWGNIGKAIAAIYTEEEKTTDCDMELVGIIRRNANREGCPDSVQVVSDVNSLAQKPDVVLCAAPSHCVMDDVRKYLELGFSTVDCFDNHKEIITQRKQLDVLAKNHHAVSVLGAGWDPGFDSIFRALSCLIVPENEAITTFGPGRSMGHTTTVKAIHPDITDAVSLTLPGEKPGLQRREVFIALNEKLADENVQNQIRREILNHPYFINDDSHVFFVESIADHNTNRHGGIITRESSAANVEVKLNGDNALMTAAAMYASARAAGRLHANGSYGCKTLAEIVPLDFVKGDTAEERLAGIKY
jgi:diaminopimelate dehydrogenase